MENYGNESYQLEEKTGKVVSFTEASEEQLHQKFERKGEISTFLLNLAFGVVPNEINNEEMKTEKEEEKAEATNETENQNREFWYFTGRTYAGIKPPENDYSNAWYPTGEQTEFRQVGEEAWKSDPIWIQFAFAFDKVVNVLSYRDLYFPSIERDSDLSNLVSVYENLEDALRENNPILEKGEFLNGRIGMPYCLSETGFVLTESIEGLKDYPTKKLVFPLIRTENTPGRAVLGYVNGISLIKALTEQFQVEYLNNQTFEDKGEVQDGE